MLIAGHCVKDNYLEMDTPNTWHVVSMRPGVLPNQQRPCVSCIPLYRGDDNSIFFLYVDVGRTLWWNFECWWCDKGIVERVKEVIMICIMVSTRVIIIYIATVILIAIISSTISGSNGIVLIISSLLLWLLLLSSSPLLLLLSIFLLDIHIFVNITFIIVIINMLITSIINTYFCCHNHYFCSDDQVNSKDNGKINYIHNDEHNAYRCNHNHDNNNNESYGNDKLYNLSIFHSFFFSFLIYLLHRKDCFLKSYSVTSFFLIPNGSSVMEWVEKISSVAQNLIL